MMSQDDCSGAPALPGNGKNNAEVGRISRRLEKLFDQALEERRFEDCLTLLSQMNDLAGKGDAVAQARLDLQRARLAFHQDRLVDVEIACKALSDRFAAQLIHTRDENELLGDIYALYGAWARRVGQINLAIASYQESRTRYEMIGLMDKVARIDHRIGLVYRLTGNWRSAIDHYEKSLAYYTTESAPAELATVLNDLGNVYRLAGKLEKALELCQRSLQIRETLNNHQALGLSYNTLGMIYRELGQLEDAKSFQHKAVHYFLETHDKLGEARAHNNLGYIYYREGNFNQSLDELQASLAILESLADKGGGFLANTLDKLGRVWREQGDLEKARILFQRDLDIAKTFHDHYQEAEARYELCLLYRKLGDPQLVHAEALEIHRLAELYGYPYFAGRAWEIEGDVKLAQQLFEEAFTDYINALNEMLDYTAKRYEELVLRIVGHYNAIPIPQTQRAIGNALSRWCANSDVARRENGIGSPVHIGDLVSSAAHRDDKEPYA